jgi:predicted Zn-dependent protease
VAEELEEIIIIDEADAAGVEHQETVTKTEESTDRLKRILSFAISLLAVLLVVVIIILLLPKTDRPKTQMNLQELETKLQKKPEPAVVEAGKIEQMIAKANFLYGSGNKEEALGLYERIAQYSKAISQYNLGVAQLKEGQYETALETFKLAIANGENRCVSAINAAVSALHLDDKNSFDYFINLAQAYLPYENNSPLYSYYYTLINYYKGNYLEVLSALEHPVSEEYPESRKLIAARVQSLFGNYFEAISALENPYEETNAFSLGLLYANVGDLALAKQYLLDAVIQNPEPLNEQLALAYVYLKSGLLEDGGKLLHTLTDMYGERVYRPYPITVFLKSSLFEPDAAQKNYRNTIIKKRMTNYQKIFYFAPYKVFDAKQTISYIDKGTANISIDDIAAAKEYLQKSSRTSAINQGIAQAIKKSLSFRLRDANTQLESLLTLHPRHSVLQYDLALTYAQMGDMVNAHKYFLLSYHLDANNYLSGIFAYMTAQLIGTENPKMLSILKDNLTEEDESEEYELYRTLIYFSENNLPGSLEWLDKNYKERPLYLILDFLIAMQLDKTAIAQTAAEKLTDQLPNEILPHLLYIDAHFGKLSVKSYAASTLNYLKEQQFNYDDLYFGPFITRFLYTQTALMTGTLYPLRIQLKEKLETTTESPQDIMNALALASIYDEDFEEAYTFYNQIIDDYKIQDPLTLFLGAIASTGSAHHANAIGLLELAKLKDSNFIESRYALGLLYLQARNNQGAAIQFQHIGNSGFVSEYFNFMIDTDILLFEKQHPQAKKTEGQSKES